MPKKEKLPSEIWGEGFNKVFVLRICGAKSNHSGYIRGLLFSLVPFIVTLPFGLITKDGWLTSLRTLCLSILTWVAFLAGTSLWRFVYNNGKVFDTSLTSKIDRSMFKETMKSCYCAWKQITFALLFTITILVVLLLSYYFAGYDSFPSIILIFSLLWTSFIIGCTLYWSWAGLIIFINIFKNSKSIDLWWFDPCRTPLFLLTYKVFSIVVLLVSLELFLLSATVVVQMDYILFLGLVPVLIFLGLYGFAYLSALAFFLFFSVAKTVRKKIIFVRQQLAEILRNSNLNDVHKQKVDILDLYMKNLSLSRFPLNTVAQITYSSVIFASVLSFIFAVVTSILKFN